MRAFQLLVVCSVWLGFALPSALLAQEANSEAAGFNRYDLFGGYSFLSNSFNDYSFPGTSHVPLNGWDAGFAFRTWHQLDNSSWHRLGAKVDVSGYYGTSLGSPQRPILVLAGPLYRWTFGKNSPFIEGQVGFGHLNSDGLFPSPTSNNSFAVFVGAGYDRRITPRVGFRVEGGMFHTNFSSGSPEIHGIPNYFARISTGLVWHF
ncbi:MAG TPA: hypothetical protein VMF56_12535 [Acidobacteriaceae bacterium]|nr:hypothetical protein [Acidobacteriaceae bacterium]